MEKGIYNYTIQYCKENNIVKKWDYKYFVLVYEDKFRTVYRNLNNSELLESINKKSIKPHEIAFITHQEMKPDRWKFLLEKKKEIENNQFLRKLEANTDTFTCRKCGSNKCNYYQLQTRSADEPMTTFVKCNICENKWKC